MQYNYRGTYDPTQSYAVKDVVSYQATNTSPVKYFFCLDANTAQTPDPNLDNSFWGVINSLSNFPNSVDTFIYRTNIQAQDKTDIARINTLTLQTTLSTDEQTELNNLIAKYRNKLFLSDDLNAIQDSLSNLQMYFKTNVDGFIASRQLDMQNYVDSQKTDLTNFVNDTETSFQTTVGKFTFIGEYNSSIQYYKNNTITYNGESYLCLADVKGTAPDTTQTTTYWSKIASRGSKGDKGDTGLGLTFKGTWSGSTQYFKNDAVQYNGQLYACLQDNVGNQPSTIGDTAYWAVAVLRGQSTNFATQKNVVNVNNSTTNVSIGISAFNYQQDALIVVKNEMVLAENVNYKINANGTSIDSLEGTWDGTTTPIAFQFIVLKTVGSNIQFSDGSLIADGSVVLSKLVSGIQTSLGKADTSYQKPTNGIPKTDLDSSTQTSLGKADSSIQSIPVASTIVTGTVMLETSPSTSTTKVPTSSTLNNVKNDLEILYWMGAI